MKELAVFEFPAVPGPARGAPVPRRLVFRPDGVFFRMQIHRSRLIPFAWVLPALAATGCVLGPRPVAGPPERRDPAAFDAEAAGVGPVAVADPRFRDSGPAIRTEMLDLVKSARDHILVGSFLLNDGPASREILDELARKARSGVQVRVIGDASSRFVREEEAFSYLEARGVPTAEFNPVGGWRLLVPHVLLERDHRKFWIVDGRHVFLGGANLSDLSLIPPEGGGNRDLMVRFDSPEAARRLSRSFVETWNESRHPFPLRLDEFASGEAPDRRPAARFWLFNQDEVRRRPSLTETMLDGLYASARRCVWLVEPYTFTNRRILEDVRGMARRGVEVNLVLSSQARAPRFRYASFYGIRDLIEAGARVWIFDSEVSPLHYKCALVDGRLAFVGSANLNHRSFRLSRELNVVFEDPASVGEVGKVVESVRRDCREVKLEEARRYRGLPFATWWLLMQTAG